MRSPRLLTGVLLAAAVLVGGCAGGHDADAPQGGTYAFVSPKGGIDFDYPVAERKVLSEMSGPAVTNDSTMLSLSALAGKVVVLNFWSTDCGPCRVEAPDFQQASVALAGQGVQFLGLDVKDEAGAGSDFVKAFGVTYPSIADPTGRSLISVKGLPASAIPITMVLDRQRRVAHVWLGRVTKDILMQTATAVAAEQS